MEKPSPMAAPMEIDDEEIKIPTPAEARAKFDATDAAPTPKKVSKAEFKPTAPPMAKVPPKKEPKPVAVQPTQRAPPMTAPKLSAKQEQPRRQQKKSPSPRLMHDFITACPKM